MIVLKKEHLKFKQDFLLKRGYFRLVLRKEKAPYGQGVPRPGKKDAGLKDRLNWR
jgi:hypothetical protein